MMKAQIVEQIELFSEAELESLEFVPEELEAIESEQVPDLDSISFEDIAEDLEAVFEQDGEAVLEALPWLKPFKKIWDKISSRPPSRRRSRRRSRRASAPQIPPLRPVSPLRIPTSPPPGYQPWMAVRERPTSAPPGYHMRLPTPNGPPPPRWSPPRTPPRAPSRSPSPRR